MNRKQFTGMWMIALMILLLAGCRPVATPQAGQPAPSTPAAVDALRNATLNGILPEQSVTLADGIAGYEDEGSGTPFVQLVDTLAAAGDLDGDGIEDTVGLLVDYTTGSADFVYLAALLSTQGQPVDALLLGDRTPVKALTVAGGQVVVDFVGPGPSDAACCPAWNMRNVYAVEDGRLVERSSEQIGEVTLADLDGTAWQLVDLGEGQPPVLTESPVSLRFGDGQMRGSAGCNDYSAAISSPEDLPQSMAVGPISNTRMLCPEPAASQETNYLDLLGKAVAWRYAFGQLAITYKLDGDSVGELRFAPTAAGESAAAPSAAPTATLTAHPWQWIGFTSPVEQVEIETPERYLLTFGYDGIVEILADCNTAIGSYGVASLEGGSLTIDAAPRTMEVCADGARGDQFLKLLESAAIYFFDDGRLYIDLMADGGTLAFAAVQGEDGGGVTSPATAGALPRVEPLTECFVQPPAELPVQFDVDCGYVVAPEFYARAGGRELKLGFTRLNSAQETTKAPLFMLAGGPGQTNISPDLFRFFQPELLGGILAERDIVVLEQRGTQYTDTYLDCPAVQTAPWTAHEQGLLGDEAAAFGVAAIQACIDDFRTRGINFDAYNSVENAADVNAVREALGYDRIIYYGASYGSQLGQHVMRDFPEILEAVVLDGAEALSRKSWLENRALDAQWGIDNLTALCAADAKCAAAYDIPALVDRALALFDNGPLPYTFTDPTDPTLTITGEITVTDMVEMIFSQQGDRYGAMSLPATLMQLTSNSELAAETMGSIKASKLLASRTPGASQMALLMHVAMICSDDTVKSENEVKLDGVGRYAAHVGQANAAPYVELCKLIDVAELPDATDIDVTTDVPTLLLGGDLDVATPTFRTQEVADALPNATFVVFPGRTHVQLGGVNFCAAQVMTQFVLDPTAPLDTSCTANMPLLGFVLPDGTNSRDEE